MIWKILRCPKCHGKLSHSEHVVLCQKCRTKYLVQNGIPDLMTKLDKHAQHQEKIWSSKTYISDPHNPDLTTIQEKFAQRFIRSLPIKDGALVVDVGCFIGEKLWYLASRKEIQGIGTDISMPAVQMAKKIDIYNLDFAVADLEKMPFADNSIDVVFVFDVIEHLSDPNKGFSEVARILKPGGLFLLHIPIKDNKYSFFWWKQKFFPMAAKKDYEAVGHTDERMLSSNEIKNGLKINKLELKKEIFYNSFFVHFFDREMMILGSKLLYPSSSSATKPARHQNSKFRTLYAKYVVPIWEILAFPDWFLSKLRIGNTYFVLSSKK